MHTVDLWCNLKLVGGGRDLRGEQTSNCPVGTAPANTFQLLHMSHAGKRARKKFMTYNQ